MKYQKKAQKRLKARQVAASAKHLEGELQRGARTKPGSMNAHKSWSIK